jgi:hypothetical protein
VPVIGMNEEALGRMHVEKRLEIVPEATHLFEEVGALEEVARLAAAWFRRYLPPEGRACAHRTSMRILRAVYCWLAYAWARSKGTGPFARADHDRSVSRPQDLRRVKSRILTTNAVPNV